MSTTRSAPHAEPNERERPKAEPHTRSAAGILGPPPRLPAPGTSWDETVEEAAAAEYLAKQRHRSGEATDDDD
jgi:hypothetical protein